MSKLSNIICILGFIFFTPAWGLGTTIPDPVQEFAERLSKDPKFQQTGWDIWSYEKRPEGGYLYRFTLDVVGDSEPELFIGSSVTNEWDVYQLVAKGEYKKINYYSLWLGETHQFGYRKDINTGVMIYMTGSDDPRGAKYILTIYKFEEHGDVTSKREDFTEQIPKDNGKPKTLHEVVKILDIGAVVEPSIEKILFQKYNGNPNSAWRPYNPSFRLQHQHKDPADAADIASLNTWGSQFRRNWREWMTNILFLSLLVTCFMSLMPCKPGHQNCSRVLILPLVAPIIYVLYEWALPRHVNIRIDLFALYPLLLFVIVTGVMRWVPRLSKKK